MLTQRPPLLNESTEYLDDAHEDVILTAVKSARAIAIRDWIGARATQQDHAEAISLPGGDSLCILADGMGGVSDGQTASQAAVAAFIASFTEEDSAPTELRLRTALDAANEAVRESIDPQGVLNGVGTTLVAAFKQRDLLFWISVGGSALWLMRDGALHRLNEDHSLRKELATQVERGELSQAQANNHPKRNALRSALVGGPLALVDLRYIRLLEEDRLLMTSEGVNTLTQHELNGLLSSHQHEPAARIADRIMSAIQELAEPRQNNTTLLLWDHQPRPELKTPSPAPRTEAPLPPQSPHIAVKSTMLFVTALAAASTLSIAANSPQAPQPSQLQIAGPSDPSAVTSYEKVDIWRKPAQPE